jgi:hypothetical protein
MNNQRTLLFFETAATSGLMSLVQVSNALIENSTTPNKFEQDDSLELNDNS